MLIRISSTSYSASYRDKLKLATLAGVMKGETHVYGTISVLLHSLGSHDYRIEWVSRMTGASTSLAKIGRSTWTVIRKWAPSKNMQDISSRFDKRQSAMNHFISNVDTIKTRVSDVDDAKRGALDLFLKLEGLKTRFIAKVPKLRLQGAIGQIVEIRSNTNKDRIVAKGILLQLLGREAEVQITERFELQNPNLYQKIPMQLVWLT